MSVFGAYSAYYDLLYRDKDYVAETAYVQSLIARHAPGTRSILDLGCGTGRHALLLAEQGYAVCGVDTSEHMLERADSRLKELRALEQSAPGAQRIAADLVHGDIRSLRLERSFDTVISLFHVMSYQTTNADIEAALLTAKLHLNPGGAFIFDCWYGPAVLTIRPSPRVVRFESEAIAVTRVAEPVLHPNVNTVDVNYQVLVKQIPTGSVEELQETHTMRYLFMPEVLGLLESAGFRCEAALEFMTGRELGFETWTAVFAARLLP